MPAQNSIIWRKKKKLFLFAKYLELGINLQNLSIRNYFFFLPIKMFSCAIRLQHIRENWSKTDGRGEGKTIFFNYARFCGFKVIIARKCFCL